MLSKLLHRFQPILHNTKDNQVLIVGGPNMPPTNPKWQTAAILGKKVYRRISAVVWPLLLKFGMVTHIGMQGIDS